jgi:hypothetical protein
MAIEVIREVTEWIVDFRQPNHTYLMDGEKVIGYQQWHEGPPIYFARKGKFDKRGRKFEKIALKDSPFKTVDILVK